MFCPRIGLPLSYPEQAGPGSCGCDGRGSDTEDTEDNASESADQPPASTQPLHAAASFCHALLFMFCFSDKKFYSLDFSHVDQEDSDAELGIGKLEFILLHLLIFYECFFLMIFIFLIYHVLPAALPLPITDYSSIIEELRSHRQEIRKLHKECSGPGCGVAVDRTR